jgi:hypothetical protein
MLNDEVLVQNRFHWVAKLEVVMISSQPWVVFVVLTILFLVLVTTLLVIQRVVKKRSKLT